VFRWRRLPSSTRSRTRRASEVVSGRWNRCK
jgi:hypothetical protein